MTEARIGPVAAAAVGGQAQVQVVEERQSEPEAPPRRCGGGRCGAHRGRGTDEEDYFGRGRFGQGAGSQSAAAKIGGRCYARSSSHCQHNSSAQEVQEAFWRGRGEGEGCRAGEELESASSQPSLDQRRAAPTTASSAKSTTARIESELSGKTQWHDHDRCDCFVYDSCSYSSFSEEE